jgi:hypothetical protein
MLTPFRSFFLAFALATFLLALLASSARAQSALGKTDFGKNMNTSEDLANSLVPGPVKYGKGEKKSEVDPKTLPSKRTKDPLFEGGLNDVGLNWTADNKMGKPTVKESDSKAPKTSSEATTESSSKHSEASSDKQSSSSELSTSPRAEALSEPQGSSLRAGTLSEPEAKQSSEPADSQHKEQPQTVSVDKQSDKSADKQLEKSSSSTNSDGEH